MMNLDQRGFSLTEMMVSLGISTAIVLVLLGTMSNSLKFVASASDLAERSELVEQIRRVLSDRRALRLTATHNPVMYAAVSSDYTGAVTSLNSNVYYGISVYDRSGVVVAGPAPDATSSTGAPVYYTNDGRVCGSPTDLNCFYSVTAHFMVQGGPQFGTTFNSVPRQVFPAYHPALKPEFMQINFYVNYLRTDRSGIVRKPITGTIFIEMSDWGENL